MILQGAEELPRLLADAASVAGKGSARSMSAEEFAAHFHGDAREAFRLKTLLDEKGSDKATGHGYHTVYSAIFGATEVLDVLEVGLGTNDESVPSTMGRNGRPGASIRAFRDFLPSARLYGADIDPKTLFTETRIETLHVDAASDESVAEMFDAIAVPLDLIIDDGLHAPYTNLRILIQGLPRLRVGGWLVIEDIGFEKRPIWEVAGAVLDHERFEAYLIDTRSRLLFVVRRLA